METNQIKFTSKEVKEIFTQVLQETQEREKATLKRLQEKVNTLEDSYEKEQIIQAFELYNQTLENIEKYDEIMRYGQPLRDMSYLLEQQYDLLYNTILEMTNLMEFWEELEIQMKVNNEYIYSKNQTEEEIKQQVEKATDYLLSEEYKQEIEVDYTPFDFIER